MKPETGLIRVPPNYPTVPTPGKLVTLLEANEESIYKRYSPYFEYDSGLVDKILNFGEKQPFIYDYITEARKGLSGLRRFEDRIFPLGSASRDVIRVTKFLTSGRGVAFLGKQLILQANQAFNETQLYNPTSPVVAAGMHLALGSVRPMRHIDIFGGLAGIARSLLGNLGGALVETFTESSQPIPPPGTAGRKALPDNYSDGGKGLLRGKTADEGLANFTKTWVSPTRGRFSWSNFAKSLISSFIPFTFPRFQPSGTQYRADEGSYGIMIKNQDRLYLGEADSRPNGEGVPTNIWIAGGKGIRKVGELPGRSIYRVVTPSGTEGIQSGGGAISGLYIRYHGIPQITPRPSKEPYSGWRYGDSVGADVDDNLDASGMMIQYSRYAAAKSPSQTDFKTKLNSRDEIEKKNETLRKVLDELNAGVYTTTVTDPNQRVISTDRQNPSGYDRLFAATDGQPKSPNNYPNGVLAAYRNANVRMVDNSIARDTINNSLKLPGARNFDAINTLRILPGEKSGSPKSIKFSQLPGWTKWDPYKDDQIAFFFYDAVNDKYIPFRATVKGIAESSNAAWEELTFIGRADRLYSYGGFTRTLSFNFDVVISSVIELAPTWKRINYLMSLLKPARYTKSIPSTINESTIPYNRFMIPPMVMLTIGDLYKSQPIVLNNLSMTVPEDAIWETMNEANADKGEWSYLVNYMKSNKIESDGKEFGQFPREARISVGCMLLEKERAIAGGAMFGHAPHTDDYHPMDIANEPYMHQALVEYQYDSDGG